MSNLILVSLLLVLTFSHCFVTVATVARLESKYWLNSCNGDCINALTYALEKKCNSHTDCRNLIAESHAQCIKCLDDIVDEESMELINGKPYFLCKNQINMQQLGCQYYCSVIYGTTGECERHSSSVRPSVCKCQGMDETTTTTQQTQTTTTTTLPLEPLQSTLTGHSDLVRSLAVLPNGDLASGSDDSTIKLWNTLSVSSKINTIF